MRKIFIVFLAFFLFLNLTGMARLSRGRSHKRSPATIQGTVIDIETKTPISDDSGGGVGYVRANINQPRFPIDIQPRSDFLYWYIQNNIPLSPSEIVIDLYGEHYWVWVRLPIGFGFNPGYYLVTASAAHRYFKLSATGNTFYDASNGTENSSFVEASNSCSLEVQGEGLKMSSVPYDLIGSGI